VYEDDQEPKRVYEHEGYKIKPCEGNLGSLMKITRDGPIPDYLKGMYTSHLKARSAIDAYKRANTETILPEPMPELAAQIANAPTVQKRKAAQKKTVAA
jgi:hypothetical protein